MNIALETLRYADTDYMYQPRHLAQADDSAENADNTPVRGVDYGPYDFYTGEVSETMLDMFLDGDVADDARTVVGQSMIFIVPDFATVREVRTPVDRYNETTKQHEQQHIVEGLNIHIPGDNIDEPFNISVSVHGSPKSKPLWATVGRDEYLEYCAQNSMRDVTIVPTLWGDSLWMRSHDSDFAQQLVVLACDGPRWTVRMVGYGRGLSDYHMNIMAEMMNNIIVYRDGSPKAPGECLPLGVVHNVSNSVD